MEKNYDTETLSIGVLNKKPFDEKIMQKININS